jgi:hypothetical protein
MMAVLISAIALVVCVISLYLTNKKYKQIKIIEYDNSEKIKEKAVLDSEIQSKVNQINYLNSTYQKETDRIKVTSQEFESKAKLLDEQYARKQQDLENDFLESKNIIQEEIQKLQSDLENLKSTKAATIESFQKEEAVRQQADLYRLKISGSDLQDIQLLRSIQFKLSKPRVLCMLIWQTFYQPIAKKNFPMILGSNKVCGIYKITSLKTQMAYIGQAKDIYKRFCSHCRCGLGIDTPQGNKLYAAMLEEGLENFTFELLESCDEESLNEKEKYYIGVYNSVDFGYNGNQGIANQKE